MGVSSEFESRGSEERSVVRMNFRTKPRIKVTIQMAAALAGLDDSAFTMQAEVVVFRSDTDMEVIPHLLSRELAGVRRRTILS